MDKSIIAAAGLPERKKEGKARTFIKNISPFNNRTEMPGVQFIIKKLLVYLIANKGCMIIGTAVIVLMHYPLGKDPLKGESFGGSAGLVFTMLNYLLPTLLIFPCWHFFEKKKLSEMFVRRGFGCYLTGCLIGAALILLSVGFAVLAGAVKVNSMTEHPNLLVIALNGGVFVFQSANEELLCRGVAFSGLKDKLGIPKAFAVSTLFFLIPHLSSMQDAGAAIGAVGMINLVLVSAIFMLVMLVTDSIWASCGVHFIWNFFLSNIFGLSVSGQFSEPCSLLSAESVGSNVLNGGVFGIEASILTTAVYAVCVAVLFVIYRRKNADKGGE